MLPTSDSDKPKSLPIFGAERQWDTDEWTASDDTVRGGKSKSHLEVEDKVAHFYGTLDTTTLGGAGFASQRTTDTDEHKWDLAHYAGIKLDIAKGDKKRYTFILKDNVLPPDELTGREQASISWEVDFDLPPQTEPGKTTDKSVFIPWDSLTPTYRGRVKKDVEPLDLTKICRMSIMMRSFFNAQQGDFSLYIKSITAETKIPSSSTPIYGNFSKEAAMLPPVDVDKLERGVSGGGGQGAAASDTDLHQQDSRLRPLIFNLGLFRRTELRLPVVSRASVSEELKNLIGIVLMLCIFAMLGYLLGKFLAAVFVFVYG